MEWPLEAEELYSPIRVIGTGGFASVWMAKSKTSGVDVAIKVLNDDGYARREIDILSELSAKYSHPNIVRLLHTFESKEGSGKSGVNYVVLSLHRGPTLNHILSKYGALGLVVAQRISRQLIDTVAFLHSHAGEDVCFRY